MPKTYNAANGFQQIRLFARGESVLKDVTSPGNQYAIEWAGRKGHPSSYGMLGGFVSEGTPGAVFDQHISGILKKKALAGSADQVIAALSDEYRPAVVSMAEARRLHLVITVAAEGAIGSSSSVFASLAAMLLSAAGSDGWPSTGHDVFALWSSVSR